MAGFAMRPARHRAPDRQLRRPLAVGSGALLLLAATVVVTPPSIGATPPSIDAQPTAETSAAPGPVKAGSSRIVDSSPTLLSGAADGNGIRAVFIQLAGVGAADVYDGVRARGGAEAEATAAAVQRRVAIVKTSAAVLAALSALDPTTVQLFQVSNVIPGLAVAASSGVLMKITARSDVMKVTPLVPKSPAAEPAGADTPLRVWAAEASSGPATGPFGGRGVKIGIVDSGIDYTHADFGGPGTSAAYQQAQLAVRFTPTAKVVGGRDFVGNRYDASAAAAAGRADLRIPHPDGNPLDCSGHGTQVAGSAAGYGVDAAGHPAAAAEPTPAGRLAMTVPRGAAPGAALYALKVFGCSGTTEAVIPALDWALDPNGDGDFADRLDIVNLSLTSPGPVADDPDTQVLDTLAELGVLPVVAAGNAGDSTDALGSPGTSTRALTVAGSVGSFRRLDGLTAELSGSELLTAAGQVSGAYPWSTSAPVSGEVVGLDDNPDGCSPLTPADSSMVSGKVAWLTWDDNDATRSCGSADRTANVRAAGAVGAVLTSSAPVFQAGVAGDPVIPVFQLTSGSTAALRGSVGRGLSVTFDRSLVGAINLDDPDVLDLLAAGSARGTHGSPFTLKPDVTAPASAQPVVRSGSGDAGQLSSGTSLAAAHVSGTAAQVIQAHPGWSAEQVKAAVMDTATHDVTTSPAATGQSYGPARVGSGRVAPEAAAGASVLAYSASTGGAVSVSFGVVEADIDQQSVVSTQSLVVQNTGPAAAELTLSYLAAVGQPGVAMTVSPTAITLSPGASALATVIMTVDPSALRRSLDPTMLAQQTNVVTGLDEPRQFLPDTSGRILLTQSGSTSIRVPVYGAAKPVSNTSAVAGATNGVPALVLSGSGFDQKSDPDPESTRYASLTSVLALGYSSSGPPCRVSGPAGCKDSAATTAGKILAVGAGRSNADEDSPAGRLWFGLSTYGNPADLGSGFQPTVSIDTTGDRVPDFVVQVRSVGGRSDLLYAYLFAATGPTPRLRSIAPVNYNSGAVDTNVFDNSVMLIPVDPQMLGIDTGATTFPISYSVSTYAPNLSIAGDGTIDNSGPVAFDIADPPIITSSPIWGDEGGTGIPYSLGSSVTNTPALVLHLHAASGHRQQILTVSRFDR